MTGLLVVAVVVLCVAVAVAFAAKVIAAAAIEAGRVYLVALERRTQHAPVADLETRTNALEHRLKVLEMRAMTR